MTNISLVVRRAYRCPEPCRQQCSLTVSAGQHVIGGVLDVDLCGVDDLAVDYAIHGVDLVGEQLFSVWDLKETSDVVVVVLCVGSWLALVCGILEPSVGGHPMQWKVHSRVIMKKYKTLGPLNYLLSLSSQ